MPDRLYLISWQVKWDTHLSAVRLLSLNIPLYGWVFLWGDMASS